MYGVSNPTTFIKLLSMNIFVISLSACQSINTVGNSTDSIASSDVESQFEGSILAPILDTMSGLFSGIYARSTIEDYIGDQDKQNIIKITRKAADTGQLQIFNNTDSGVQGKAEVVMSKTLPTLEEGNQDGVRECKTVRQTIVLKDRREITETVTLCIGPDGWN